MPTHYIVRVLALPREPVTSPVERVTGSQPVYLADHGVSWHDHPRGGMRYWQRSLPVMTIEQAHAQRFEFMTTAVLAAVVARVPWFDIELVSR